MTWKTISEIICKSNSKRKEQEKIIVDSKLVLDKQEICERFNDFFFTNIGPNLAEKIETGKTKRFDVYLKQRVLTTFSFRLMDDKSIAKYISSLATKESAGHDGISLKLLKYLSPVLTKSLCLIINQSLVTGIFPTELKIAKVLPVLMMSH